MLLRAGSNYEFLVKAGSLCLQGAFFFLIFLLSHPLHLFQELLPRLWPTAWKGEFRILQLLLQGEVDKIDYLQSVFWGHLLLPRTSWAMKMPLLPTPTVPSIRPSNQMQLIDLNSYPSICARARESKSLCYWSLQ